mmetsp:Transcript_13284/g.24919  ORF Transcript_13284/g.24919 Transcript_13284/m.24919 type:complete len:138 (-) Transcript_13284:1346-1759(-)
MSLRPLDWEIQLKHDEDEVVVLEDAYKKQRSELQLKKTRLEEKKKNDWEWQQHKLKTKLKELDKEIGENEAFRGDAFTKVSDLRFKALEVQQEQLRLEDELKQAGRLTQVEHLVRKKLELEKLREKRQELDMREDKQ